MVAGKLPLGSVTISSVGQVSNIDLNILPPDLEVVGFMFDITATGTTGSGTQAVTAEDMVQIISKLSIDSPFLQVLATGRGIHTLGRQATGYRTASASLSVTCTTGGNALRCVLPLWLRDKSGKRPSDFAIPGALLRDKSIQIEAWAGVAGALTLDLTVDVVLTNLIIRPYAIVQPIRQLHVPSITKIFHEDFTAALHRVPSEGLLQYACLYDESDLSLTLAEYAQMSMSANGQKLIDRLPTSALVSEWNELMAEAAADELSYIPSAANAFLPLVTAPKHFSILKLPRSGSGGIAIEIESGSLTSGRILMRQIKPCSLDTLQLAGQMFGYPADVNWVIETANGGDLDEEDEELGALFLPKRMAP